MKVRKLLAVIIVLLTFCIVLFLVLKSPDSKTNTNNSSGDDANLSTDTNLQLDPNKNYGDKYASGILPVGDNQFTSNAAEKGKVFLCNARFAPSNQAGAQTRGPWFIGTSQWDINKKYSVKGEINW